MSSAKTWFKIVFVLIALGMVGMCAIAGAGVYFVSQHVNTERVSSGDALRQFTEALAVFKDQKPVIDIDIQERVTTLRDLTDLPTAPARTTNLVVMAWDPDEGRIVNFTLPLWVLSMGQHKVDLGVGAESLDLRRLNLDVKEIARVGPQLILDFTARSGERILVWTE